MGAQTAGSGDIAAGIAAHGFDANQRAAKDLACCTINPVPRPGGKGIGERTGHSAQIGNSKFAPVAADAPTTFAVGPSDWLSRVARTDCRALSSA